MSGRKPVVSIGERFGMLVVLDDAPKASYSKCRRFLCACDCGRTAVARSSYLRSGRQRSCGCLRGRGNVTHGMRGTSTYRIWYAMIQRCTNPNDANYHRYGGRGISVCKEWTGPGGFSRFFAAMGERPGDLTLDRNDNDRGYCAENCQWRTRVDQARNTRRNHIEPHEFTQVAWLINERGYQSGEVVRFFGVTTRYARRIAVRGRQT